jgi:hypothetical protein
MMLPVCSICGRQDYCTCLCGCPIAHPKLSANDCFCLVTTQCHQDATLLTGDGLLRRVAAKAGLPVHGILWVVDEIRRLGLCNDDVLVTALERWQNDPTVFLPAAEIDQRLQMLRDSQKQVDAHPPDPHLERPPPCGPFTLS